MENVSNTEMEARIQGVDIHMQTFNFLYGALHGELVLSYSDKISKTLESPCSLTVDGRNVT